MTDWTRVRSERLALDRPVPTDAGDLFTIHHDPRSWSHFPQGRHLEPARTQQMVDDALVQWATDGLGYWTARHGGRIVGWAGCAVPRGLPWWNLVWRGPDVGNDDPEAVRLVYLDRDPADDLLGVLASHGMGSDGLLR